MNIKLLTQQHLGFLSLKVWKLRDPQTCSRFQEVFKAHVPAVETEGATTTEEIWAKLKTGLLKTTEEVCGTTKPHRWRHETCPWNKEVDDAITAKRQAFKAWKAGKCTRASYNTAKRISRRVVHHARHEADKVVYEGIDHKSSDIFRLANQMRKENVDVVGNKPVKNDTGEMSMSERQSRMHGLNIMKGFSTLNLTGTLITCPMNLH